MRPTIGVVTKDRYRTWEMKTLARVAKKKGVGLILLDPDQCTVDLNSGRPLDPKGIPLPLDACLGRVDAGCLHAGVRLLECIEARVPVLNGSHAFHVGRDKRLMSRALASAGLPHPQTWLVPPDRIPSIARYLPFPVVVKPAVGSEGRGIHLIKGIRPLYELAKGARHPLYLQAYCRKVLREIRVLVLDGATIGAILRRPKEGEWRGNLALGARAEKIPVDDAWSELALRAAAAVGADFAGVDLVLHDGGASVLEVNVCPNFQGFAQATGIDVTTRLVDALLSRIEKEGVVDESVVAHRTESLVQRS